jgi:phosphoglycolate phosphatase
MRSLLALPLIPEMIKVRSMLFDLDGTIIDSKSDLARSVNLMLRDLGRPPLDEDTVGGFVGDGVRVLVHRSLTATDPERRPPNERLHAEGIALMHSHYADQMLVSTRLYPHVAETLRHFKDKRKGLVTSKEVRFAGAILDHFGIAGDFDCIIGGDTVSARKPDPEPVRQALLVLGCPAADAVMVGDSENDVLAGSRAGTVTCAVSFGFRTAEQLRLTSPDVLVDSFDQLKEHFF